MKKTVASASPSRPRAQQKRSQGTFDTLVNAAGRVLDREGLEGATVPNIATEAKLSAASIYRRFADKDDLLRAAFLRVMESAHTTNAALVRSMVARDTLAGTVDALIAALLKDYRDHPRLLTALSRMVESEPDSAFAKEIMRLGSANMEQLAKLLLDHRRSIRHPNPERAARFAVLSATSSIELAALGKVSLWRVALRVNDKIFAIELARQMLAYLHPAEAN
ncbi:MAG: TetR/AcrR family transcriptional regulator [Candidatus Sulfotelmatobacter sp.]